MSTAVAKVHRVQGVRPNEICEAGCPAPARVAFLMQLSGGRQDRVVLCAHHFADLNQQSRDKIIATHESK